MTLYQITELRVSSGELGEARFACCQRMQFCTRTADLPADFCDESCNGFKVFPKPAGSLDSLLWFVFKEVRAEAKTEKTYKKISKCIRCAGMLPMPWPILTLKVGAASQWRW